MSYYWEYVKQYWHLQKKRILAFHFRIFQIQEGRGMKERKRKRDVEQLRRLVEAEELGRCQVDHLLLSIALGI